MRLLRWAHFYIFREVYIVFNYDNIGEKIKNLAKWAFIVEAIGAVITGIFLMINAADIDDVFSLRVYLQ